VEKCGRAGQAAADFITRRISVACGITNAAYTHTHTHRIYNNYFFSTGDTGYTDALQYYLYAYTACLFFNKVAEMETAYPPLYTSEVKNAKSYNSGSPT
jgi:hypothetical protein